MSIIPQEIQLTKRRIKNCSNFDQTHFLNIKNSVFGHKFRTFFYMAKHPQLAKKIRKQGSSKRERGREGVVDEIDF
jgi:hypothetical protein